jgi:hypothetical protein
MGFEADRIDAFLDKQVHTLSEESGYMRSLVFKSCFSFASAGSKKPEGCQLEKGHQLPSWVVIHAFSDAIGDDDVKRIELNLQPMNESVESMQGEIKAWSLQESFGEKKLFEEVSG